MSPAFILTRRIVQLLVGLFAYGIGISLMVQAGIGIAPWDVLTQGISHQTGLDFGLLTNIIGAGVLLCWIPIRQRPGFGTLANVLLIGPSAQLGLDILPKQALLVFQLLYFVAGLLLVGVATGLYIGARLGPGPRDGLMTGIHARTGWRLWAIRTVIEVTVLLVGWGLGGNFGPGTIAFALLIGPMVAFTIPALELRGKAISGLPRDASALGRPRPKVAGSELTTPQSE
jgi:uncharacterized membrane protein YczE